MQSLKHSMLKVIYSNKMPKQRQIVTRHEREMKSQQKGLEKNAAIAQIKSSREFQLCDSFTINKKKRISKMYRIILYLFNKKTFINNCKMSKINKIHIRDLAGKRLFELIQDTITV